MLTRNQESRINEAAIVTAPRSTFDYGQDSIFDFEMGYIIPFFCDCTIMPGDQYKLNLNMVLRLVNPTKFPIMTPLYVDVYGFFVADRLIWDHIKEFYGENPDGFWTQTTEYTKPKLVTETGFTAHSIVDYLYGCNLDVPGEVDARPVRAMNLIYNDWFRNQNVIAPIQFEHGDSDTTFDKDDSSKGGTPYKIAKYGDIFTRSLPQAIKGDQVTIPLGNTAPVYGNGKPLTLQIGKEQTTAIGALGELEQLQYIIGTDGKNKYVSGQPIDSNEVGTEASSTTISPAGKYVGVLTKEYAKYFPPSEVSPGFNSGMYTDLSAATAAGMNQLIEAMSIYSILYRMAIGGTRYTEITRTFWGVSASDARLGRSEYLGGFSQPIDMTEIPQTSASTENSPQANVSAYSHTTTTQKYLFNKGFTEHGTIIICLAVRQRHYYSQGLERCYSTFRKYDNYMPPLANLGPMEVKNKEIYMSGIEEDDNETFGFQEAWYWLRGIRPSKIMGIMRPTEALSLSAWHLGDDYDNCPVLGQEFIEETDDYLKRAIAVQNTPTQFICTTFVYGKATRVMPTSSIPSLRTFF